MWPLLALLLFLIGFWLFVRWDRRRLLARSPGNAHTLAHRPQTQRLWLLWTALSVSSVSLAASNWLAPDQPPYSGRLGFALNLAHNAWGAQGPALFWLGAAVLCAAAAWLASPRRTTTPPRGKRKP